MEITYIGEHLLPGKIGNFFVQLAFVSALFAAASYFMATQKQEERWRKIARIGFYVHGISVIGTIGTLFYMLINHLFEYHYVWQHSNQDMPLRYIFSCFWEGQEGSFLLWSFWHVVIGFLLIRSTKNWEAPVMATMSIIQAFISSMLLGIYVLEYKIGSNPFSVLLREHPDFANLPFIKNPNYLAKLDGRGLNPLLQNYWMTIHPPTLFLGFAATAIPFAFAIAGLWTKKFNEWQKPALPWTFFGVMILGTGILMGGAWAYEALSFGGFWAWDPVENASLVPWLTFVGGAHVMMIHKNKGGSLFTTFFLIIISFILILYSTFLTRSGILGDSSVHAFTDLGMSGQLLLYLFFFIALALFLFIIRWKEMPRQKQEEDIWSREFWMFIGALVLLISSFQISFTTSIPVINKVFNQNIATPADPEAHYNTWQIPFAIAICVLLGVGQFFKYKQTDFSTFLKKIAWAFVLALVISIPVVISMQYTEVFYAILFFATTFAFLANLDYVIRVLKGKIKNAGASIAHIGFALILMGALLSTSRQEVISFNTSGMDIESLGEDFQNNNNILLMQDDTLPMGDYLVSYRGKKKEGINIYFEVEYNQKNEAGIVESAFTLFPRVQTNPRMGNIAEPDTRHFLHKDIYTHVTYADLENNFAEEVDDNTYTEPKNISIGMKDSIFLSSYIIKLDTIENVMDSAASVEIAVQAVLTVFDFKKNTYQLRPVFTVKNGMIEPIEDNIEELGIKINFVRIHPDEEKFEFLVSEKKSSKKDFIVMEAIVFPYINVLWMGCIIMIMGTLIAIRSRLKRS